MPSAPAAAGVTVIDPAIVASPALLFEVGAALGMGKKIVAVVPRDFDASQLPHALRVRRYLVKDSPQDTADELAASEEPHALGA